jgi:Holliday junction resolvasome RuvABC endonuclease subunit
MEKILAIDPSIHNCGWCIMSTNMKIITYGLIQGRLKKNRKWIDKANHVSELVHMLLINYWPKRVFLEFPEYWAGSIGSQARESGSVFKLYFLCGSLYQVAKELCEVKLVKPSEWKGQLKKEIVRKRLKKQFPNVITDNMDHNVVDAIGIAYYTLKED